MCTGKEQSFRYFEESQVPTLTHYSLISLNSIMVEILCIVNEPQLPDLFII